MPDYCTGWFDRIGDADWSACCRAHDIAYGLGADKLAADIDLATCVASVAGWPMAMVMFIGVVTFGLPFWIEGRRKR